MGRGCYEGWGSGGGWEVGWRIGVGVGGRVIGDGGGGVECGMG